MMPILLVIVEKSIMNQVTKEKFYVVWKGVTPGVYTRWTECQLQTKGFEGAIYKSFETHEEARKAFL